MVADKKILSATNFADKWWQVWTADNTHAISPRRLFNLLPTTVAQFVADRNFCRRPINQKRHCCLSV